MCIQCCGLATEGARTHDGAGGGVGGGAAGIARRVVQSCVVRGAHGRVLVAAVTAAGARQAAMGETGGCFWMA